MLHELATNAAKHGSLSAEEGRVAIDWRIGHRSDRTTIYFKWQERGGPPIAPPCRRGFGTVLLERAVTSFETPPRFNYATEGFSYELTTLAH